MGHVVSYARYSSHNQRETSIKDQQRICKRFADQAGLSIKKEYSDSAMSGKSDNRPSYLQLRDDIEKGTISILLIDDLSRLSRKSNICTVIEEFKYFGVRIISVSDGIDSNDNSSKLLIGIKSAVNSSLSDDMKNKIRRGQEGNVLKGWTSGGRIYGYKPVPIYSTTEKDPYGLPVIDHGILEINEDEAKWILQIFKWAKDGKPYKQIAHQLNNLSVPSAYNKGWTASTISSTRYGISSGILNNQLYIGIKVWNKTRILTNPITDKVKKISRDKNEWVCVDMPELRIISNDLWDAVKNRQETQKLKTQKKQSESHPNARTGRAPGYLFSSILKCGICGSNLVIVDRCNYRCSNAHKKGDAFCTNRQKIHRDVIESKLLTSIKSNLFNPAVISFFHDEANKMLRDRKATLDPNTNRLNSKLATIEKDVKNIFSLISTNISLSSSNIIADQIKALELEKQEIEQKLREENNIISSIEPILPRAMDRFRELVNNLPDALEDDLDSLRSQIKSLLGEKIIMTPDSNNGWKVTYKGSFQSLLRLGASSHVKTSDVALKEFVTYFTDTITICID